MISPTLANSGSYITFTYGSGPPYTWTMTYTSQGRSFASPTTTPTPANNGSYGFILQISMIL
jgi:hypothetical protein